MLKVGNVVRIINAVTFNGKSFVPKYALYVVSLLTRNKNGYVANIMMGDELFVMNVDDLEHVKERI